MEVMIVVERKSAYGAETTLKTWSFNVDGYSVVPKYDSEMWNVLAHEISLFKGKDTMKIRCREIHEIESGVTADPSVTAFKVSEDAEIDGVAISRMNAVDKKLADFS
jgi:hypothetical protein